jgi:hypothetical protein
VKKIEPDLVTNSSITQINLYKKRPPMQHHDNNRQTECIVPSVKHNNARKGKTATPMTLLIIKTINIYESAACCILKSQPHIFSPTNLTR